MDAIEESYQQLQDLWEEIKNFSGELSKFLIKKLHLSFLKMEEGKGVFVNALYKQRGKMARRLIHFGMAGLAGAGMMIAPVIAQEMPGKSVDPWNITSAPVVLSATTEDPNTDTQISDKIRGEIIQYTVQEGDTVSTIAKKFGVSEDTIRWQNNLASKNSIKVGQTLEILPVTGILHKVQKGDTVNSIAKRYDASAQGIVDYPYNTFVNDETFDLAIGQTVVVPDGVKPAEVLWSPLARVKQITPNAGTVVASGQFVWPTGGTITQRFAWYHKGVDIANNAGPGVLAADAGTIVVAGWPDNSGYGNRVVIDHGNGYKTLYGHLAQVYVTAGQTVKRGDAIGKMGSTGRSTGTHLHFEVIKSGAYLNPLNLLQ
jgi:murein DD-endopeptidase MepM/ murein hydrolase activator NlpD